MIVKITITGEEINQAIRQWIKNQRPVVEVPEEGDIDITMDGFGNLEATYEVELET